MRRIGIMGAPLDNPNHGCMALLYSLIYILEEIASEEEEVFHYTLFDWKYSEKQMQMLSGLLAVSRDRFTFAPYVLLTDPLRFVYHLPGFVKMRQAIQKCDVVIDLTEGDGFSDIYGDFLFLGRTRVKRMIERMGIALILGPQTYGPYQNKKNRELAITVLKAAGSVMTRDVQSYKMLKETAGINAWLTSDLAFFLPRGEWEYPATDKVRVGINASNLLYGSTEMKDRKFKISADYEAYLDGLLQRLLDTGKYEIYLISHVNDDYAVHAKLHARYPKTHLVPIFENPVQAKACISAMDVFAGARMHGTIAAFTSGVACISTAYSAKFEGLFAEYDYHAIVNLCELTAEAAIEETLRYIEHYDELTRAAAASGQKREKMAQSCKAAIKEALWIGS